MSRKKFLQDLDQAKRNSPAHITNVERYDGDGISFNYWYQLHGVRREVGLKLITTNLDEYPDGNQFMIFTEDSDVDRIVTDAFEQIQAVIDGASVNSAIREISDGLQQALTLGQFDNPISFDSSSHTHSDADIDDFDIDEQEDADDDVSFGFDDILAHKTIPQPMIRPGNQLGGDNIELIKRDLLNAKDAGFKIGVHGDLSRAGIVCISIRIAKIGISEEAMQAWGLSKFQYLVLLIRFHRGYKFLSQVMEEPNLDSSVEMRVGLSDTYKPRVDEAYAAFNQIEETSMTVQNTSQTPPGNSTITGSLKSLFIGRPVNDLLRERFPKIVKFRHQFGLTWYGAERMFNDRQGALFSDLSRDLSTYNDAENVPMPHALPKIVMKDALSEVNITEASLPLVSMQFVLRHLVRCTEFCLVCHCRVEDTFEALKPYVCSNPLCLYQFMALGFGPAAEWEILSQPYVVDLLISLCYSQARVSKMKEYPLGVNLRVPVLPHYKDPLATVYRQMYNPATPAVNNKPAPAPSKAFKATFDPDTKVITPIPGSWTNNRQRVTAGDWVVLVPSTVKKPKVQYCRVVEEQGSKYACDSVISCLTAVVGNEAVRNPAKPVVEVQSVEEVDCFLYDTNFEDLPDSYRHHAITSLLDTLPPVSEMRKGLIQQQGGHRDANLSLLRKLCPPSALDLLRWIIASNRSCIMQVDEVATGNDPAQRLRPSEDRVSGMDEYMQFRFAQGAPDKEQRFVDCVKAKSSSIQHPTLFAWHGSPLHNWHSIIRQGLNFDEILHGRANGNGIYMSPHVNTSLGYTADRGNTTCSTWSNSVLKPTSVVSLQEVVNAPSAFVCVQPHFVVAEKDWIQTRYLFVKTNARHSVGPCAKTAYQQDPVHYARGTKSEIVSVPITAISKSRRPGESMSPSSGKKRKHASQEKNASDDSDDAMSVATNESDLDLFRASQDVRSFTSDDVIMNGVGGLFDHRRHRSAKTILPSIITKKGHQDRGNFVIDGSRTDFVPGSLDTSGIRFLDPPKDASISATKALMRAFNDTIHVQEVTPLHDLGFYIDPHRMENMYQWIVELHSFDKSLPLAQDMKAAGVTSIVFEMQFTNDFPFSPPFVRVVKPRFLDPMMGGGGHITSGGAICMELLTSSGWSAVNSIESVLLQVRLAMSERERPARLLSGRGGFQTAPYPIGEAIAAYKRFCQKHGWQAPKGLDSLQAT